MQYLSLPLSIPLAHAEAVKVWNFQMEVKTFFFPLKNELQIELCKKIYIFWLQSSNK